MKIWHWGWVGLAIAMSACNSGEQIQPTAIPDNEAELTSTATATQPSQAASSCEAMATQVPLPPATDVELPFERFDFRPTEVEATKQTLTFRGRRYEFTFCKGDRTWGIEALEPTPAVEEDYAEYFETLGNPDYEIVTQKNQNYQARVRLDASWLNDANHSDEDVEEVIFELIKSGERDPVATVLYTNNEIIERELGATAGVPVITQTLVTDDALWWSIGFEQGEGASGIATIVQYQIDQDEIILWQPSELGNAQITDLALTTSENGPILWLGTQYSGEGNPYLPAKGLVAYHPTDNTIQSYTAENSPLIGAIPTRLWTDEDKLWAGTGNGICEIDWAAIDETDSWDCWRFTAMADIPTDRAIYPSSLAQTAIEPLDSIDPVEVLWLADMDISTAASTARYEIKYAPGLTTELGQGADYYVGPDDSPDDGYFWWPGQDWSWNGQRFIRPWDQIAANYVGSGPQGIGPDSYENYVADWQTMRGEFELLELTPDTTEIKYYSAWVDGEGIDPWVTVTQASNPPLNTDNPTEVVLKQLKQATPQATKN